MQQERRRRRAWISRDKTIMLKKLAIALGALVALVVIAAFVGPSLFDWNSYKPEIAAEVRAQTGRDFAIDGDITVSILPTPTLSVAGARLANAPGGSAPDMASFDTLKVRVALLPLLSGDIKVESIDLVKPSVLLERYADGSDNWHLAPPPSATAGTTAATGGNSAKGFSVSLDKITIEQGRVAYQDAEGTALAIEDLDADLSAQSLQGPFAASGAATAQGIRAGFEATTGALAPDGQTPISLALTLPDAESRIALVGTLDQSGGQPKLTGHLTASAARLSGTLDKLAAGAAAGSPVPLDRPFNFEGDVVASTAAVELSKTTLQFGDSTAKGAITYETSGAAGAPPRLAAKLAVNKLDLDALMGDMAKAGAAGGPEPAGGAPAGAPALDLPTGIDASLDLTIDTVAYRNGVISAAHVLGKLEDGQLKLTELTALLPGNTDIKLDGALAGSQAGPQFNGSVTGRSDNVRTLLGWLGVPLPEIPSDRLHKLTVTSRVAADPQTVQLSQMDLTVDTTRAAGGVTVALPGANRAKPAFGIGLAIDQINIDGYMPPAAAGNATEAAGAPGGGSPLDALKPLAAIDANAQLKIGSLTYNAQTIQDLNLDGSLADGVLTLRDLSVGDFAGGSGKLSGTFSDLAGTPRFDARIDLAAKDAARALRFAGLAAPATTDLGSLKLSGSLAGGASDVSYDLSFSIAGIKAAGEAKGTASGLTQAVPRIDSTFSLSAKDAAPLLVIAGLGRENQPALGALSITGTAASGADEVSFDVDLKLADIGGAGKLKGKLSGLQGTPVVDTALDLSAKKPAPLLALAGLGAAGLDKLGALKVAGTLAGNASAMKLDLGLDALGGTAKVAGSVGLPPEGSPEAAPQLDLTVQATHPE
jgi:uncharacterized protein involved in outer membrane biogenesis